MKPLENRVGMSTLCMESISIEAAIGKIRDAGFKAIKVVPVKVQRDANMDYWMEYFGATKRLEIALLLQDFETVTVHSSVPTLVSTSITAFPRICQQR